MKTKRSSKVTKVVAMEIILLAVACAVVRASVPSENQRPLNEQVRHELLMRPFLTVFDNIEYKVNGDMVTLQGQVTRPFLKSDAESAVKRIAGVSKVINNIEVLPQSSMDDQIRRAEFHTIYSGSGPLSRYGWGPIPSVHIIVNSGRVTLRGVVDTETDKNMATLFANQVFGVFSVQNDLTVAKPQINQ